MPEELSFMVSAMYEDQKAESTYKEMVATLKSFFDATKSDHGAGGTT